VHAVILFADFVSGFRFDTDIVCVKHYGLEDKWSWCSTPDRGKRFLSSPNLPQQFDGFLSKGYRFPDINTRPICTRSWPIVST